MWSKCRHSNWSTRSRGTGESLWYSKPIQDSSWTQISQNLVDLEHLILGGRIIFEFCAEHNCHILNKISVSRTEPWASEILWYLGCISSFLTKWVFVRLYFRPWRVHNVESAIWLVLKLECGQYRRTLVSSVHVQTLFGAALLYYGDLPGTHFTWFMGS